MIIGIDRAVIEKLIAAAGIRKDHLNCSPQCVEREKLLAVTTAADAALSHIGFLRALLSEYMEAANDAYEHRYGISYDDMRERIAKVKAGEFVTHEEVMRRVRDAWSLPVKAKDGIMVDPTNKGEG